MAGVASAWVEAEGLVERLRGGVRGADLDDELAVGVGAGEGECGCEESAADALAAGTRMEKGPELAHVGHRGDVSRIEREDLISEEFACWRLGDVDALARGLVENVLALCGGGPGLVDGGMNALAGDQFEKRHERRGIISSGRADDYAAAAFRISRTRLATICASPGWSIQKFMTSSSRPPGVTSMAGSPLRSCSATWR